MKLISTRLTLILVMLILVSGALYSRGLTEPVKGRKLDLTRYHNVGNIWLRVSNYGFFGSGGDISPQWPSLEYPGGSSIDYLYRGALWFGAKKVRRNGLGQKYYWKANATSAADIITESDSAWTSSLKLVIDTLVTVGFDGDLDLKEFLPAYNPLETSALGLDFNNYNGDDIVTTASIRTQRRAEDDDGDGRIDEDPVGYAFPFRSATELPTDFSSYGSLYLHEIAPEQFTYVPDNEEIWFPLGFVDLSADPSEGNFCFTEPHDDDMDGLVDEDGYPVSEQDFIAYYYDYSPFGTGTERDWGESKENSSHYPLKIRVRQMSYQWGYEHLKNLVYVEFDITNMNFNNVFSDTLYDCAMGIYMDSDVGPQAWDEIASDDVSSYVAGEGAEYAFSYDYDGDGGLTTGIVGSRVCSPDPEQLEFACWTWDVGDGPDDTDPQAFNPPSAAASHNDKYWLLTNYRNPNDDKYTSLRDFPNVTSTGLDTRYLFGFYGAQEHTGDTDEVGDPGYGIADYLETDENGNYFKRWNLAPGKTMKIVVAVFPGDNLLDLNVTSSHAKYTYGTPQDLVSVTLPDTFIHYTTPDPPEIPMMFTEMDDEGEVITVYWDNRSEIDNEDTQTIKKQDKGWQTDITYIDSYIENWDENTFPPEYAPYEWDEDTQTYDYLSENNRNINALVNPWRGYRLRHDFQGYSLWGRSGSGSQEFWMLKEKWDKIDTEQDLEDYEVNLGTDKFVNFGGETGINKGLPNIHEIMPEDIGYYHFDENYILVSYEQEDVDEHLMIAGYPIYNKDVTYETAEDLASGLSFNEQALLFKHSDLPDEIYLELYDDNLIPLDGHLGQIANTDEDRLEKLRWDRLARRYYISHLYHPPKGIEYYVAVSAWDRGMPSIKVPVLESARDEDGNMDILFPGPSSKSKMNNIYVVPNPYIVFSRFDGRRDNDTKGDKSRRLWFVNLPEYCQIKIWTLAGDLVDEITHNGSENYEDIITLSKSSLQGKSASGIHSWDMLSRYDQIIAPGVYLFTVIDRDSGDKKVGKFVIVK
ncbi:MAG: hypothetical protein K9N06_07840 [Candidatus Cloacimonetes bacterium]|nr:hypothetical protein [Candidatus Cloacimonadota bacterium]